MNNKNIKIGDGVKKEDWPGLVYGLRKKLNLSQTQLHSRIGICRQSISRFEAKQRTPNTESATKILTFIRRNNLKISELRESGKTCSAEVKKREKAIPSEISNSQELAELIGIVLGDGEIKRDGSIRIAFDPKKDKNFLFRRIFPLVKKITNDKIGFESDKRICFGDMGFVRYLRNRCNLKAGSKFEHNWEIPDWCFDKEEYLAAVLRGLFDTDGYIGYHTGSVEIMFGRFSSSSTKLVQDIGKALTLLSFKPAIQQSNDGRFKVRLTNKKDTIAFFKTVGTSNIKHVVRFLLWRIERYEAKIEKEGLPKLINMTNNLVKGDIQDARLPFHWKQNQYSELTKFIEEDDLSLQAEKTRKAYKWPAVSKTLIAYVGSEQIARELHVTERSVRKWREGTRTPSPHLCQQLLNIAETNKIDITKSSV